MFFFVSLFVQDIWGYSALRTGVFFLPLTAAMLVATAAAAKLVSRTGPRPLLAAGALLNAGGLYWLSLATAGSTYASGMLGPMLMIAAGLGLLFLPLQMVSLAGVAEADSGAAASLLNSGRQVGGSIGLALLGTVAWTVVANRGRDHAYTRTALVAGFDRAFLVGAGIAVLMLVAALASIRVRRTQLGR